MGKLDHEVHLWTCYDSSMVDPMSWTRSWSSCKPYRRHFGLQNSDEKPWLTVCPKWIIFW